MDTNERIRQLMNERGWTEYRLAKEAGLSQSTIANLFRRNTIPSVVTLEAICSAMGITLAQFFSEGRMVELTGEQKDLFDRWVSLTKEQKGLLYDLMKNMK
jgi:transcriptional regulator with XRE-family HTH domain